MTPIDLAGPLVSSAALLDLPDDPATRRALAALQQRASRSVDSIVDRLATRLRADFLAAPEEPSGDHGLAEAGAHARRQAAIARDCRLLAQEMVFASLLHLENPQWNPLGPATPAPPPGVLAALLSN